jgi:cardiolipin synthase
MDLSLLLAVGHVLLAAVFSFDVLLHKHRPVSAVLWLATVWAFPYVGALLYLVFGVDRVQRGGEERKASKALVRERAAQRPLFEQLVVDLDGGSDDPLEQAAGYILRGTDPSVPANRVLRGNHVEFLIDGDQFYPQLIQAIEASRQSVHLQTFIFGRDALGRSVLDALEKKAREGVAVRLLYDRFGSAYAHFTRFFERTRKAGVRVCSISQANPLKGRFQINLRNHRKVAIIDGEVGFVGGINIASVNSTRYGGAAPIRDYHVKLLGPAVSDLQIQFLYDWYFATKEPLERLLGPECFPQIAPVGDALVQIVPGGPEVGGRGLADAFFAAVVAAERSVAILTPYFVPDEPIVHALRYAAIRGVDVRLVVPKHNNHWYTGFAARSLYTPLLRAGARVFERRPPFMHAKVLVVDDVYAMLGSANLDYRSLHLNFETNIEIVEPEFVDQVRGQIENEIAVSEEVTWELHSARSLPRRLAENFCFLLQPLL